MPDPRVRSPRSLRLRVSTLVVLVGTLVVVTACTSGGAQTEPEESPERTPRATPATAPGVLYAFARQPSAIVPAAAVDADDLIIVDQLFDGLTAVDVDLEVVPAVASQWEVNEDATVHTFHLRADATFHDGTAVTAEAFVRAWERVADRGVEPPSAAHHLLDLVEGIEQAREGEPLSGVEAVDEHTLRVTLTEPFAELPALVSHPSLAPLPVASEDAAEFDRMPVGNGPFRMVHPWQPGQFIRMEPFEDHPDANSGLDQLVFRIYEGEAAGQQAYEDFLRGTLHIAPIPEEALREALTEHGTARDGVGPGVVRRERLMTVYYAFNVEVAPFDDPDVRRAIALAVDHEAVLGAIDADTRVGATSLVPDLLPGYEPARCVLCAHAPDRARELLEEAEVDLEQITLTVHDGGEHVEAAEQVKADVAATLGDGVIAVRSVPTADWLQEIRAGEAGFFLSGWIAEYPSPGAFIDPLFHPGRIGTDNLTRYADPEVGGWLAEARGTLDPIERYALYQRIEERILDDAALIPLYHYRHARVLSDRAPGIVVGPTGLLDLTRATLTDDG